MKNIAVNHIVEFEINAREVWKRINTAKQFHNWFDSIQHRYQLSEPVEFITKLVKNPLGGRPIKEIFISKALARIIYEDSPKHRKETKEIRMQHDQRADIVQDFLKNPVKLLEYALDIAKKGEASEKKLQILLMDEEKHFTSSQVGSCEEVGLSAVALNGLLKELGFIYFQSGIWIGTEKIKEKGYLVLKEKLTEKGQTYKHSYWTEAGRLWICENIGQWKQRWVHKIIEKKK